MRQKTHFGELDLFMQRGQKILVLEVKFRRRMDNFDGGLPGHQQIKRMKNAVLWVSGRYPVFTDKICICGWFSGRAGGAYAKPISISRRWAPGLSTGLSGQLMKKEVFYRIVNAVYEKSLFTEIS